MYFNPVNEKCRLVHLRRVNGKSQLIRGYAKGRILIKQILAVLFLVVSLNSLALGLEGIFVSPYVTVEVYVEEISNPQDLSFDSLGYLYVANDANADARIHRVSPDGTSVDFFGPTLSDPDAVIVDANDDVLVGCGCGKIYKVQPDGSSSVFASTYLGNVCSITIDYLGAIGEAGTIYVGNARAVNDIVKITPSGEASSFQSGSTLRIPFGLTFSADKMFIAETEVNLRGLYSSTGSGNLEHVLDYNKPYSVLYSHLEDALYMGDTEKDRIYKLTPTGVFVYAAGVRPHGMTFGADGCLYVSDRSVLPGRILKFTGTDHFPLCDSNIDGYVDLLDCADSAQIWLSSPGSDITSQLCDCYLPLDDYINMDDFSQMAQNWWPVE